MPRQTTRTAFGEAATVEEPAPSPDMGPAIRHDLRRMTDDDLYLFNEGSHFRLYEKLGSHPAVEDGVAGTHFGVWAPNAEAVSVMGDFNGWNRESHPLHQRAMSGVWEAFVPGVGRGDIYKYFVVSRHDGYRVEKADPFAVHQETPPKTGSVVWDLEYTWNDAEWMAERKRRNVLDAPISIYEVHLGSWMRPADDGGRFLTYREVAPQLAEYAARMGFTHVELLPIMEHPFYGSWGYQTTGFFAPTSRFGTPQDFMYLVDTLHQHGVGVILDWVPSHFPNDQHGLAYFDGTHLYEHADPRQGHHPDWKSAIFNYGRNEVRSFLLSSALYWLGVYHTDGLRVDAVASMLYLDYSRQAGEWVPNQYGGRENLEAISFLQRFNQEVYAAHPDVQTFAEESTAWPSVSRPLYLGGLGFGLKWDMGWMHDTLHYMSREPIYRYYHHNDLTFRGLYMFSENYVLPLSHDEVVHLKGSLIGKMPGDEWQKFANMRALHAYMAAQPGKKLLFMGGEFGQWGEWSHDRSLDWHLLEYPPHDELRRWVEDLNRLYRTEPTMHERDCDPRGFEWIDANDSPNSVVTLLRTANSTDDLMLVAVNFTPVPRYDYRVGVPRGGFWREVLNSDAEVYGGGGIGNQGGFHADEIPTHNRSHSLSLTLPPLGAVFLKIEGAGR